MLELKEAGDFANSLDTMARKVLGPAFPIEDYKKHPSLFRSKMPNVEDYIPVLHKSLEEANRTREHDSSYPYFAMMDIIKLAEKRSATIGSTLAVPWTVAAMILTEDSAIKQTSEINLRLMLDIALGFAVSDYSKRADQASRAAAYYKSPEDEALSQQAAEEHKRIEERLKYRQLELREPVSICCASQKK